MPAAGATLTGSVTLTASAADSGSGVGGVQFRVDGINVGPAIHWCAIFELVEHCAIQQWGACHNRLRVGSRTEHRDLEPCNGHVLERQPGNPSVTGLWSGIFSWPLVSIHLSLLSDGRVMAWDQMSTGTPHPRVWDPVTSTLTTVVKNDTENLFCAAHTTLSNGKLLVAGGEMSTIGSGSRSQSCRADEHPSVRSSNKSVDHRRSNDIRPLVSDGDHATGRAVLALQGETVCFGCDAITPEIYNPATNSWAQLATAPLQAPWYPYTFVLPDGRVLVAGGAENADRTQVLDLSTSTWSTVDARVLDGGSAAMYLPGRIIKSGSANSTESAAVASKATTYVIDMTGATPSWRTLTPMAFPRTYHVLTTLADGSVLATGGGRTTGFADIPNAVYQAELWSPATESWSTLASMTAPRLYHQTAILLPDGRVLVSGSGRGCGGACPTDQLSAEIFSPPYLFKGPRPTIASAPSSLTYGQQFAVSTPDASRIARVALVRNGSTTHTFSMDTRYVPLTFTAGTNNITVTAPANGNMAPPGYYMLFLIDNAGVPSEAAIVRF